MTTELMARELATELVATEPVATELVATELVVTELVATELVATELVATELVATELVATELVDKEQAMASCLQQGCEAAEPEPEPGADPEEAEVECPCWNVFRGGLTKYFRLTQEIAAAGRDANPDPSRACLVFQRSIVPPRAACACARWSAGGL